MPDAPDLIIRADADSRIGSGHLMRSLALAHAWAQGGGSVSFLSRAENPAWQKRVESLGFKFLPLAASHPSPDDLRATLNAASPSEESRPWLALDGYHFDGEYQKAARAAGCRVLALDDYGHAPVFHADLILNQNAGAETRTYACDPDTLALLGSRYALLRPEFLPWKDRPRVIAKTAQKILVTLGGADPDNATLAVVEALARLKAPDLEAVIVLGADNPHEKDLRAAAGGKPGLRFERNVLDMPALMAWADLAVTAGGSTCWETAFMGLPNLMITLADNQRGGAKALEEAGVSAVYSAEALEALLGDASRREKMSAAGKKLVDGLGAERVVRVMRGLSASELADSKLALRESSLDDMWEIWRLANEPSVRGNSFNKEPIALEDHRRWYEEQLSRKDTKFWVLEVAGTIAAQIRYTRVDAETAEVHFAVRGAFQGKGLGTRALLLSRPRVCSQMGVARLRGVVIEPNEPSARAFLKAGYTRVGGVQERGRACGVFERPCS